MNKTIVIYHRADFDGIFCRHIAEHAFRTRADYLGWDYGDPIPVIPAEVTDIYMLDISIDKLMDDPRLTWIDHHQSAISAYAVRTDGSPIKGYRIDGVAACRLAWQWFTLRHPMIPTAMALPTKEEYIARVITEPLAVRLAGEYDVWDKRDPNADLFQHALRGMPLTEHVWETLLNPGEEAALPLIAEMLLGGRAIEYAKGNENASIIKAAGFTVKWEGLTFLACNAARYNSHLFVAGTKPEHDALLGFNYVPGMWKVSLYGAPGKPNIDLSAIAIRYGGGGHRQACGFSCKELPFPLP